jgi:hypothetical protein
MHICRWTSDLFSSFSVYQSLLFIKRHYLHLQCFLTDLGFWGFLLFVFISFIVVLDGGTLWHL